jgi:hypothetical protein
MRRWSRRSRARGRSSGPRGRCGTCFARGSGAILSFRYLDNDTDADGYQGHAYSRVYVEELPQFPLPLVVDTLKATLRSAEGAPHELEAGGKLEDVVKRAGGGPTCRS